jgi:DNA-binding response OmpR family regulator
MKQVNIQPESSTPSERRPKILVVDDDLTVRESVRRVLADASYEVELCGDGDEALACLAIELPNLVVLDLNVPKRNGWEVFEQIITYFPTLPVIIITGLPAENRGAVAAGAGALLEKPLEGDILLQKTAELLNEPEELRLRRRYDYLEASTVPGRFGYFKRLFPSWRSA